MVLEDLWPAVCLLRYFNAAGARPTAAKAHQPESLIPLVLQAASGSARRSASMEQIIQPQTAPASGITSISPTWSRRTFWRSRPLASPQPLIYNLGNGAGYSVREVIEIAREVTGRPIPVDEVPRRPGDAPAWWPPPTAFAASWAGSPAILPCRISSPVPGNGTAATLMGMINVLYDGWSISHHPDSPAALHLLTLLACCSSGVQPVVALPDCACFRPMRPLTSSRVLILPRPPALGAAHPAADCQPARCAAAAPGRSQPASLWALHRSGQPGGNGPGRRGWSLRFLRPLAGFRLPSAA